MAYQGREGLTWWQGVVEDRNDPMFLNRVRVRIYGAHTWDKQKIATPDLPWSDVMMPTTAPSISGLGQTMHGLVEGSTVMGFYRDGEGMQDSVVMGSFIGSPTKISRVDETIDDDGTKHQQEVERKPTDGFNDPRLMAEASYKGTPDGANPDHIQRNYGLTLALEMSPRHPEGQWENYPKESYLGSSDVNKLARQDGEYDKTIYPNTVVEAGGIGKTLFSGDWGFKSNNEDRASWVKPKHPFNHVYESESGHVIEIDDSPYYERINVFHRSGARIEINNKGEFHIIAAPGQDINLQGANVNINNEGSGNVNVNALGKCFITAEDKIDLVTKAEANIKSVGNCNIAAEGATSIIAELECNLTALKDIAIKCVKTVKIQ